MKRKIFFWRRKIEKLFGKGKYVFAKEKKNKEGKGEKYSEKENILPSNEKEVNIWRMKEDISETK